MRPDFAERANDNLSLMAEMAVAAARDAIARWGKPAGGDRGGDLRGLGPPAAYPAMAIEIQQALGARASPST